MIASVNQEPPMHPLARAESLRHRHARHVRLHRRDVRYRLVRVHHVHRSTHRRCEPRGIAPGFHHQIERYSIFRLFVRQVPRRAINAEVKSIFFSHP